MSQSHVLAQLYPIDPLQDPPGINWREIATERFRIIYPADIEKDAIRTANLMEHVYPHVCKTLGHYPKKTPIILRTNIAESNGFATYAPRRSEWFNAPPQSSFTGTLDWYSTLGIHEFRHVVQFDNTYQNTNKVLYLLFGEAGQILGAGAGLPGWYFEGDAVATETALTESGRGRLPMFDADLRALMLSGKSWSYYTAMFGSYAEWDPLQSPYLMGYYLVSHVRRNHGDKAWRDIVSTAMWLPFIPQWFTFSMNSTIDRGAPSTYESAMNEIKDLWSKQIEGLKTTDASLVQNINQEDWTYNINPFFTPDGDIIVWRYGLDDIYSLIQINRATFREKELAKIGQADAGPTVAGTKITWAETVPDPRWGMRSWSVIHTLDIATGEQKVITDKSRFYAPALSPDARTIAVVEFSAKNQCSLVLLNSDTGAEIKRFLNLEGNFIQTPRWSPDGKRIVYCAVHPFRGKALQSINSENGKTEEILPFSHENIITPVTDGKFVYYVSSYSGIDNIYATDILTKKTFQVTSRKFGAYYPALSPDGTALAFSDVTKDGFIVMRMNRNPQEWAPQEKVEVRKLKYYEPMVREEAGGNILTGIPEKPHETRDYSGAGDLVNVHSWMPIPNWLNSEFLLTLYSRNLLGTMQGTLGYIYNWNEKTHAGEAGFSYGGWYPVIEAGILYGGRASTYDNNNKTYYYSWKETSPYAGVQIPLNFSRGVYQTFFTLAVKGQYTYITDQDVDFQYENNNGTFIPVTYSMQFFNGYRWIRDINPVWGQLINVSYAHTPFKGDYSGRMLSADAMLFFPGIFRHNSFHVEGAWESQESPDYRFESLILFPRGYAYEFHEMFCKGSANYLFPVMYPDANFIHIIHFRRIFANLFFDYGMGLDGKERAYYRSAGAELSFEILPFAWPVPLQIGFRYSYLLDKNMYSTGIFFGLMM